MSVEVIALEFGKALAEAVPALFELFKRAGGRDAFLVALDAGLAAARAKTDVDLDAKHNDDTRQT